MGLGLGLMLGLGQGLGRWSALGFAWWWFMYLAILGAPRVQGHGAVLEERLDLGLFGRTRMLAFSADDDGSARTAPRAPTRTLSRSPST